MDLALATGGAATVAPTEAGLTGCCGKGRVRGCCVLGVVREINRGMQLLPLWLACSLTRLPFLVTKFDGMDSGEEGGVRVCTTEKV